LTRFEFTGAGFSAFFESLLLGRDFRSAEFQMLRQFEQIEIGLAWVTGNGAAVIYGGRACTHGGSGPLLRAGFRRRRAQAEE